MSGTTPARTNVTQLFRTATPNNPPPAQVLLDGELSVEQSDPVRLWVGVPTAVDPTGRRLIFDAGRTAFVTVSDTPPAIAQGALWFDSVSTQLFVGYSDGTSLQWVIASNTSQGGSLGYAQLPPSLQTMPVSFAFPGKPVAGTAMSVPVTVALSVPNLLVGAQVYATSAAQANAPFTVNRVTGGVATPIGTVTFTTGAPQLTGAGGVFAAGDVLQIVAPTPADNTLTNPSITLLTTRM